MIEKLLIKLAVALAPVLAPLLLEKLVAIVPVLVAAATKSLGEEFRDVINRAIPDVKMPDLGSIDDVAGKIVRQIPDIDIPGISDKFDLTEWLKGRFS